MALQDKLPFDYDLDRIIDDWVLMGFLVGNDFIPHLPNFHIHQVNWCVFIYAMPSGKSFSEICWTNCGVHIWVYNYWYAIFRTRLHTSTQSIKKFYLRSQVFPYITVVMVTAVLWFHWLGYINNGGNLDLVRFEMFLQSLSSVGLLSFPVKM